MHQRHVVGIDAGAALDELQRREGRVVGRRLVEVAFVDVRERQRRCLVCGAGRADGMRATEGRFLTGRRSAGRTTGLGTTGFFALAALRAGRLLRLGGLALCAGVLPLPDPFTRFALGHARFPLPA